MKHSSFPRTLLRNICRASLLLLLAAACSNEKPADEPNPDDKRVTVEFLVPGITSVGTPTRSVSALPEGATVSILVSWAGESPSIDLLKGNQTYYVKGGRLVPCTVDDNGKFIAEDPNGKISLEPWEYDFYVCTPALKIIPGSDGSNYASIVVPQNLDYAASITDKKPIAFTGVVALDALTHECARLQLKVNSDDAAITAMTVKSATLTGFADDKKETYLGHPFYGSPMGGGTKSATTTAFIKDGTNPKLFNADLFLLPCTVTTPVKVAYEIVYTVLGIERTETVSADLPTLTLVEGKSYTLTANFTKDGGIHLSISDWEQSDQDNSMGEGTYPYVQNGNTIVSKDLYGSAGAIYHKSWTATPDHNSNSGYYESVSSRFEVAANDVLNGSDSDYSVWSTTNGACSGGWRRPTVGELKLMYAMKAQLSVTAFKTDGHVYWSAASYPDGTRHYQINFADGHLGGTLNQFNGCTRCIRDGYPYITKNAEGRLLVVVSKDEYGSSGATLHPNWAITPPHNNTDAANNTMSAMFEVMSNNLSGNWYQATGTYHASENPRTDKVCPDGWRMPTFTELRYIALNQGALGGGFVLNNYWSATEESTNAAEAHMQGFGYTSTAGARAKNSIYTIRCVRDL